MANPKNKKANPCSWLFCKDNPGGWHASEPPAQGHKSQRRARGSRPSRPHQEQSTPAAKRTLDHRKKCASHARKVELVSYGCTGIALWLIGEILFIVQQACKPQLTESTIFVFPPTSNKSKHNEPLPQITSFGRGIGIHDGERFSADGAFLGPGFGADNRGREPPGCCRSDAKGRAAQRYSDAGAHVAIACKQSQ
ncbi:MAG: hypothetical protein M3R45_11085 [Pseudomonadota bacterium]|nr:hypothetical protein [Pseudomonadota bacterium]